MNCYNGEKFLHQALDSIVRQTYQNWELIFWDNKSNDQSKEIFYSFKDSRFKYYLAENHTKLFRARNLASKKATGDYLAFLDTDDYWVDIKLESQLRVMKSDRNLDFCFTKYFVLDQKKDSQKVNTNEDLKYKNLGELFENYQIGLSTVLLSKKIMIDQNYKFNDNYNIIGDFDLFSKLIQNVKFKYIEKPLAIYRWHSNNLSTINNSEELDELNDWLEKERSKKKIKKVFLKIMEKKIEHMNIIRSLREKNYSNALKKIIFFPIDKKKIKLIFYFFYVVFFKKDKN